MQRRTILKSAAAVGLVSGLGIFRAAVRGCREDQARGQFGTDRGRCAELLHRRRHAAVKGGAEVVPIINKLADSFQNIVVTQDWHTPGHASFASTYAGKKPFETTKLSYGTQVLWPDHCVQGTDDAALNKDLKLPTAQVIIRKGFHKDMDSYSAFEEADHKTATGLGGYLKQRGVKTVFVTGPGDRLLRRLDRDGRAQGRLRRLRDRGRDARHRPQRLAGCRLEADGREGREASSRPISPELWAPRFTPFAAICFQAAASEPLRSMARVASSIT